MSILGKRIREERERLNLTQTELGKICGVTKSTISLYESGKSTPNDDIKQVLANYFDVSIDYLLGRTDNRNSNNDNRKKEDSRKKEAELISVLLIKELIRNGTITGTNDIDENLKNKIIEAINLDAKLSKNLKKDAD